MAFTSTDELGNADVELDRPSMDCPHVERMVARNDENISMPVQLTTLQDADQPLSLELMLLLPTNAPAGSPVARPSGLDGNEEQTVTTSRCWSCP